jgi:ABC-type transport system substrate-binding protein
MQRLFCATLIALCCALAAQAADPNKVIRYAFQIAETSFDPARVSDRYSNTLMENVLEPMLTYDYLARPVKLRPNTLSALPEIRDGGTTFVFRIKPGIFFTPHQAFKGKRRELTAADYEFSLKRHFDPKLRSPWLFLFEDNLVGGKDAYQHAKAAGNFDYDAPIEGLRALDRYTLQVRLKAPDFNLPYIMAMPASGALARELVELYGEDIGSHPVGTGPYKVREWKRSSKIVLEANPDFREEIFESEAGDDPLDQRIAAHLKGKKLPLIGRVEVSIVEENQPRWLAFLNREHDYIERFPEEYSNIATPGGNIAPNLAKQGITLQRPIEPTLTYYSFNIDHPVVGGYTPEKVALRRAIGLAYNINEELQIIRKGQSVKAESPVPPGVAGSNADFRSAAGEYNPAKAKALLDLFGYLDRDGDGYRELPDGKPLVIEYSSTPAFIDRMYDELWKKSLDAVGIRMASRKAKWPDLLKATKVGQFQFRALAWGADYPDAENFLQLLYGPNTGQSNDARFRLPEFDRLYEKAKRMPDSPERSRLYEEMNRLILVYAPWKLGTYRVDGNLIHPWVIGYKKHPILRAPWRFLDIDVARQAAARQ